ncbi:MAG: amidohydrolase, partial [Clostridia bacterium]|nr:amidohydrolase [Clostridia bacterium]
MNCYKRAVDLKNETIAHRRFFHRNAETGLDMPKAVEYVMNELGKIGINAEKCGKGVMAMIGSGGKCILLRADMDALPMKEESGLDFASENNAHTCG